MAKINFTQRVGTVSGPDAAMEPLDLARAMLRTTFPPRLERRAPRFFFELRVVALTIVCRLRRFTQTKARRNRGAEIRVLGSQSYLMGGLSARLQTRARLGRFAAESAKLG
jgi:hypothetical protein